MVAVLSPTSPGWWCAFLPILLLAGCRNETKLGVTSGQYRARLKGSLTDTLSGPAVFRRQDDELVGMELGSRGGPGLSFQLGPHPLQPRSYVVVEAPLLEGRPADRRTGVLAFLSLQNVQLRATRGSLSVSHVGDGEIWGTFDFDMRGGTPGSPGELSVRVTGELRATAGAAAR